MLWVMIDDSHEWTAVQKKKKWWCWCLCDSNDDCDDDNDRIRFSDWQTCLNIVVAVVGATRVVVLVVDSGDGDDECEHGDDEGSDGRDDGSDEFA